MALIEESRRSYREKGGIGLDDLRQELGSKKATHPPTVEDGGKKS
jgi:hypothetical protein